MSQMVIYTGHIKVFKYTFQKDFQTMFPSKNWHQTQIYNFANM